MIGTIVNTAAIVAGSTAGLALRGRLRADVAGLIMQAVALFVLTVGIQMALGDSRTIVVLASLVLGSLSGDILRIEQWLEDSSRRLESWLLRRNAGARDEKDGQFTRGFLAASLLFCVGPMAVLGAFQDGVYHDITILMNKSLLDGVGSIALAASLGPGVALSAASVFLYQGVLTLAASSLRQLLSDAAIADITVTGGVLIIGLGLNMLRVTKIRVGNMLPALLFAALLAAIADAWFR